MIGLGIGLGVTHGTGGAWFDTAAIVDADITNGRFRHDGVTYASKATFLAGIGVTESSGAYTFTPYVDPAAVDLVSNGDMSGGTTGYTGTNGTIAIVGGELELTGGGVSQATATQPITAVASRGYRVRGKATRVTGGPGTYLAISGGVGLAPTDYATLASGVDTPTDIEHFISTVQTSYFVGLRQNGTSTGKSRLDNLETKLCVPVKGASQTVVSARMQGTMPAAVGGASMVIWQSGDTFEKNRVRLEWNTSARLRLIVTLNNIEQANLDIGEVLALTDFDVSFSVQTNIVMAQLNGGVILMDTGAGFPGQARGWWGRSATGEAFTGTLRRVQVYDEWMPPSAIWLEGDSYPAGDALGTSLWASLQSQTNRRAFVTGLGSSTLTSARDRVLAHTGFAARNPLLFWDGYSNSYGTLAADMAKYAAMAAVKPDGKFLFLAPLQTPFGPSDVNAAAAALQSELTVVYGSRCLNLQPVIDADPASFQPDTVHLAAAKMNEVASVYVEPRMTLLGF